MLEKLSRPAPSWTGSGTRARAPATFSWQALAAGSNPRADLNYDGTIDEADESLFGESYQKFKLTSSGGFLMNQPPSDRRGGPSYGGDSVSVATSAWGESYDNRFGFCGYVWDPFVKIYHVRHRAYDPIRGRWLQQDPIGYLGGDKNLYRYCMNQPWDYTDPSGLITGGDVLGLIFPLYGIGRYVTAADNPTPADNRVEQRVVNSLTGFGDGLSLGTTAALRSGTSLNDVVDSRSADYRGGVGVGVTTTVFMTGGTAAPGAMTTGTAVTLGLFSGGGTEIIVESQQQIQGIRNGYNWGAIGIQSAIGGVTSAVFNALGNFIAGAIERAVLGAESQAATRGATTITENAAAGRQFEQQTLDRLQGVNSNVTEQVSVRPFTESGELANFRVRLDGMSTASDGTIVLTDAKASATAGLTRNQREGYPLIERFGGQVVGNNGLPFYPPGTIIPPTPVCIPRQGVP